ncbi:hypothetical protein PSYAC_13306 [Pseudomonas syringae pv. actinidiae str. M302091]|uniref:hypothetical protein n=1 Tax=Pseudomonas syringae TaxID=317 RepID=UPI0002095889|nr:hypothetical protein [Pseudomonas syringae]EGH65865.1 hypothetical protein PSYAC_13306 [Pseudomonas syringae pv. actinidiae str. M302091]NVL45541.1 hypothetical protein [Pseudomonas syringae pv. actinidiae]
MRARDKRFKESIELAPSDWLFWRDEDFNSWRRQHDFPRIVEFLFDSLPYFSLWLSEQVGLTEEDLLFHGPSRFIRFYGEEATYIEHNVGISLFQDAPARKIVRYEFIGRGDADKIDQFEVLRQVRLVSYIDWAFSRREWAFPNKVKDIGDIARFFTPSGRSCQTSDFSDSHSNIQFNIPLFMPSISIESLRSNHLVGGPPMLELLKLGGGGVEVANGLIGEKNLEFANIDNLTLISPIITSFQSVAFSTLRNFKIVGSIHAMTFYQCSVEITVSNGGLFSCRFEYGDQKIDLKNSKLDRSSIRSRRLGLKLSDTEILDCCFKYSDLFTFSSEEKKSFHKSAKMIFSHLGYPDLAGKHFLLERKSERINKWEVFSGIKRGVRIRNRLLALLGFFWMSLQELYWGYGEKPFNVILSSIALIFTVSIYGYYGQYSSTYGDVLTSAMYSFQSYTNISIMEIKQASKGLKLTGAVMSFFGLMSVGLLVASLSSKSKNYN